MPSRNIIKEYVPGGVYHAYNRGIDKRIIFEDPRDFFMFIHIMRRYLSAEVITDSCGRTYKKLIDSVEIIAYCLMPTHFHLLVRQMDPRGMEVLMGAAMQTYSSYYNRRYKRDGTLFQTAYKARQVIDDADLWGVSRYIHNNPLDLSIDTREYPYSSLRYYLDQALTVPDWLNPALVLSSIGGHATYQDLMEHPLQGESLQRVLWV